MVDVEDAIVILGTILFLFCVFLGVFASNTGFLFHAAAFFVGGTISLYNVLFFIESARNRP